MDIYVNMSRIWYLWP